MYVCAFRAALLFPFPFFRSFSAPSGYSHLVTSIVFLSNAQMAKKEDTETLLFVDACKQHYSAIELLVSRFLFSSREHLRVIHPARRVLQRADATRAKRGRVYFGRMENRQNTSHSQRTCTTTLARHVGRAMRALSFRLKERKERECVCVYGVQRKSRV
jgi:hypothetical protein